MEASRTTLPYPTLPPATRSELSEAFGLVTSFGIIENITILTSILKD